jgi:hypothetical protein
MSALSEAQTQRINQIFANLDIEWAVINDLIPRDEQEAIKQGILDDMRRRDIAVDYPLGQEGLWEGLSAMEIKNYLLFVVNQTLEKHREQIRKVICEDFGYCKRRRQKQFEQEGVLLCIGVADALLTALVE